MARAAAKQQIVTFKADRGLLELLRGVANRSEFIRAAILSAMESVCPLCRGSGLLTPHQKRHWDSFSRDHELHECEDCHAMHLVCRDHGAREHRPRHAGSRPHNRRQAGEERRG